MQMGTGRLQGLTGLGIGALSLEVPGRGSANVCSADPSTCHERPNQ
jgi:hypothetical protein